MDYSSLKQIEFRRKFFKLFGAEITVTDPNQQTEVAFIRLKAWRLKEDIRVFTDRSMATELLRISARSVIDFGATYDVTDSSNNERICSFRRKGLRSTFVRDSWDLLDSADASIGSVEETSSGLAIARRWIDIIPFVGPVIDLALGFVPQTYQIIVSSQSAGIITQRKNPVLIKLGLDRTDAPATIDPRIAFAAATLTAVIDAGKD